MIAALDARPPDAHRERRRLNVGLLLIQAAGLVERRCGAGAIAALLQELAETQVCLGGRRLQPDRLAELRQRRVAIASLLQNRAEHVVRFIVAGPPRDGLA